MIKVRELQARDRLMNVKFMQDQQHISPETICQILREYLKKNKVYMKFVTHSINDEQKVHGATTCVDFHSDLQGQSTISQLHHD